MEPACSCDRGNSPSHSPLGSIAYLACCQWRATLRLHSIVNSNGVVSLANTIFLQLDDSDEELEEDKRTTSSNQPEAMEGEEKKQEDSSIAVAGNASTEKKDRRQ